MQLPSARLLVIKDRNLLLACSKNKQCFYLPGGKIDNGETAKPALCREVREELSISLTKEALLYYTNIPAPACGETEGVIMEQDCFLVKEQGSPVATAEKGRIKYFTLKKYRQEANISPGPY